MNKFLPRDEDNFRIWKIPSKFLTREFSLSKIKCAYGAFFLYPTFIWENEKQQLQFLAFIVERKTTKSQYNRMIRFWVIVFAELPTHRYKTPARISSQKMVEPCLGIKTCKSIKVSKFNFQPILIQCAALRINESIDQFFNAPRRTC